MKVIVSALSLALTVIASSLPAHFIIFDILQYNTMQCNAMSITEVGRANLHLRYQYDKLSFVSYRTGIEDAGIFLEERDYTQGRPCV